MKHEPLRKLNGYDAKKLGRELRGLDYPKDKEFEYKISKAIVIKILTNKPMQKLLAQSGTTPLFHYYLYESKVIMPKDGLWMISLINNIRTEILTPGGMFDEFSSM